MKYAFFTGLLAIAGVNGARTSFVMPEDGGEPVEHLRRVPDGWAEVGAPSADRKMNFRIAVRSVSRSYRRSQYRVDSARLPCRLFESIDTCRPIYSQVTC